MSNTINSQFDQGLNSIDWVKYPQLMQKVVSAFMVQMSDTLNKLREVISLAQAKTSVSQLKFGFDAASSVQTSGFIQAGVGAFQVGGGGYQVSAAFNTAGEMGALRTAFEENDTNLDSQINSANTSIEPVPVINEVEEDGIVVQIQQVDAVPQAPISQERIDVDALHAQKDALKHKYATDREDISHNHQKHYGIGQVLSGLGGLLHMIDGGTQAQKASNDAANGSFEHNHQTQEATRHSVNQTVDKLLSIDMYALNVASSRA
ncbi:hypothetical protein RHABOEDO_001649 [Candidatus Rhabdochlamydia oedothoracis]|uniref:Uncharacterized protein n=1 Tax=Candidatus Rhabdochlamydia oedothoracis TaxID=2720720 RepID=A0ABX8V2G3_9BACT|nr:MULTISPECIES: hypothetical protein [Rhabdochlamydia]KAG6559254.1 hypothetical protein RHOW815_000739 [Candidatus Rhabdochlamydia sp. W815]MCL6756084.1 hypothetical protein [Candidatus Rhabdochlamydia oedothoracis]QYF49331.1 hypothetical protein RHABOEDO_001649 [Candidatus Rhabdochlamydia oedothoracis]